MQLKPQDKVRTKQGKASIVFYESDILQLEPNTEVLIKEVLENKISNEQSKGTTWNSVSKITGRRDYVLETPTTVATIRDTAFSLEVGNPDVLIVGEDTVNVCIKGTTNCLDLKTLEKALISKTSIEKAPLTAEEKEFIKQKFLDQIEILKKVRQREIDKKPIVVETIKKTQGISESEIQDLIDQADQGRYDLDSLIEQSPIQLDSVEKIKKITEEIIRLNKLTADL